MDTTSDRGAHFFLSEPRIPGPHQLDRSGPRCERTTFGRRHRLPTRRLRVHAARPRDRAFRSGTGTIVTGSGCGVSTLFAHPSRSRFGSVPPRDEELVRAFLDGAPLVFTGAERWNALGLGTTAVSAERLVYNTKRSGRLMGQARTGDRVRELLNAAEPAAQRAASESGERLE